MKKLIAISIALITLVLLVACNNPDYGTPETTIPETIRETRSHPTKEFTSSNVEDFVFENNEIVFD